MAHPIDQWKAQLAAPVDYQTTPLGPADLETRITAGVDRHRQRFNDLAKLKEAGHQLRHDVSESLDTMAPGGTRSPWRHLPLIGGWFAPKTSDQTLSDSLWDRYEQALSHIRELGHHIELLERDLAILDEEVRTLNEEALGAARDADAAEAHAELLEDLQTDIGAALEDPRLDATGRVQISGIRDAVEARVWKQKLAFQRFRSAADADLQLLELQRELRRSLTDLHRSLSQVHSSGLEAMADLTPHLSTLASEAAARDLAEEAATSVEALRGTLAQICGLAHDNAIFIEEHLDQASQRMQLLDENSAERRRAQEEVERVLAMARGEVGGQPN